MPRQGTKSVRAPSIISAFDARMCGYGRLCALLAIVRMRRDGERLCGFDGQERGAMPLNALLFLELELLRENA